MLKHLTIPTFLLVSNLLAQTALVRNWAAPLYWRPSAKESAVIKRAGQERPEQMPPNGGPSAPLVFVAITPCRMMDTRGGDSSFTSVYGAPALTAGGTRTLPVAGVTAGYCSIPSAAEALSVNVTLWPAPGTRVQWLTLWPAGQSQPVVSTINDYQGTMFSTGNGIAAYGINNAAIVPLGTGGAFNVYVTDATNLFIDVNGYYMEPTALELGAGTRSAPSLSFANDPPTGLYSPMAGGVAITTSGTDRVLVDLTGLWVSGNLDFSNALTQNGATLLQANIGSRNTALGLGASSSLSGTDNTALGSSALTGLTTGFGNTAVGSGSLWYNSSNESNTAVGWSALHNNAADGETAVGVEALGLNSTGTMNTALGTTALANNTIGGSNTAVGYQALVNNTGTNSNTAVGTYALSTPASNPGSGNTAIGYSALLHATGDSNIGVGSGSGAA